MSTPSLISTTSVLSLSLTVLLLGAAYLASLLALPKSTTAKTRAIYIWHIFDGMTHLVLEGSFLYYSLLSCSSEAAASVSTPTLYGNAAVSCGARYSSAPLAQLWQEYARADVRWAVADVGIVCIELVTVLLGGPAALWIAAMVRKGEARQWFWISVLAVAEIYGGWMTFAPEWISGNNALVTGNWMYKWLYLAFFNGLWVVIPLWLLWEAYWQMVPATEAAMKAQTGKKRN
ncbi:Emopamil-binding protein [Sphaerosporella brunnea]|uniref:Emopamil-binding protein n=1 Tax=Sphaerosporella brunnea TaxID=1250544 RepID=A0A5J5F5D6_9PEZI|nr:Emopamil-binding protein [Sphaerosporella brunnea]